MGEKTKTSRRALLLLGIATASSLAGCSGGDESTNSPESTATPTNTPTATPTETETPTPEDPAPSLDEFAYPEGADQNGVDPTGLFETHQSTLTDAGSATLTGELTRSTDDFEETVALERRLSDGDIATSREDMGDGLTELRWSPSGDSAAYVQLKSGFNERYRIDNEAPNLNRVVMFSRFQRLLQGAEWGEATEVVSAGENQYAVKYEATGIANEQRLLRLQFGDSVTEFDATIAVSQAGYLREISYDITTESSNGSRQETSTTSVKAVGETTVEEPNWAETAREKGIQFKASTADDQTSIKLEMVNGGKVPADARVSLSDANGRGEGNISEPVTPGDSLSLSLSDSNELLVGTDGPPDGGRTLKRFARATIRYRAFELFVMNSEL